MTLEVTQEKRPLAPQRTTLLADLASEHRVLRDLLDRLDREPENRASIAEELSCATARHRSSCMEGVLDLVAKGPAEGHEQQVRLLLAATRGIDQLSDRLRLPARDPGLLDNVVIALHGLVHEHERLELELARAMLERDVP